MAPALVLQYGEREHKIFAAGSGTDAAKGASNTLDNVMAETQKKLGIMQGTYDLYDRHGKIKHPGDLVRAMQNAGAKELPIEVREHPHFARIRIQEDNHALLQARVDKLEIGLRQAEENSTQKVETAKEALKKMIAQTNLKISDEILPNLESLNRDRTQLQKDTRKMAEKLAQINVAELHEIMVLTKTLHEDVRGAIKAVSRMDTMWATDKGLIHEDCASLHREINELQRYIQGKIDVCIEADADLRRDESLLDQRMQLLADEVRLVNEDTQRLDNLVGGAHGERENIKTLLEECREDNIYLKDENVQAKTRLGCLEIASAENWPGFVPGVQYFQKFHSLAVGCDVKLSADNLSAFGRGNLAATGVVLGSDEGLAVADGPCRRFGTPGLWCYYFEVEHDEICAAPDGTGGMFIGFALDNAEEIAAHPKHEFDGWLLGGPSKALIARKGTYGREEEDPPPLPGTWAPSKSVVPIESAADAVKILRAVMPARLRGDVREVPGPWASETTRIGDIVGCLFRCNKDGGARLRVTVNNEIVATHTFLDAPPAEAVGFLTPLIRIAGMTKSVRIFSGKFPPAHVITDFQ